MRVREIPAPDRLKEHGRIRVGESADCVDGKLQVLVSQWLILTLGFGEPIRRSNLQKLGIRAQGKR